MFKTFLVLALSATVPLTTFANSTAQDFQKSKDYAKSLGGQLRQAMNQFHPETTFENYNSAPSEERLYQGIEAEKADLSLDATNALKKDIGGQTVVEHFGENQFEVNTNSNVIKNAKLIEDESYALTHGMSNARVNCDEKLKDCEMTAHEERCHTSRLLPDQTCVKKRVVSVGTERIHQRADFEVWVAKKWTGTITVNLITGAIGNAERGHLTNPLKPTQACAKMTTAIHSILNNGQQAYWAGVSGLPSCENKALVTLFISKKFNRNYPLQIALTVDVESKAYVREEHWDNDCLSMEKTSLCHRQEEACTDATATRVIDGLPVSRDCWQYAATYRCSSAKADECLSQKEKGCLQTTSRCERAENNACSLYEQTYRCEEKVCPAPTVCVKDLFCADGDCTEHEATQNEDFGSSMAPLAVAGEAGREFSQTQASLFKGRPVQCKIWLAHLVDCCSHKGWADKINLNLCREEDKVLGKAKLTYLAHYVGKYCSEKVLGVCTEHKRTYCVFDSKMARIIQEEGRLKQLNPNALGDAEHTTCAGLRVEELQQLDLGRIDFASPTYPYPSGKPTKEAGIIGEVALSSPDKAASLEEMKRRIQQKAAKP